MNGQFSSRLISLLSARSPIVAPHAHRYGKTVAFEVRPHSQNITFKPLKLSQLGNDGIVVEESDQGQPYGTG